MFKDMGLATTAHLAKKKAPGYGLFVVAPTGIEPVIKDSD
jgi:hypothetical protein